MQKERAPFPRGLAVIGRATAEFVTVVEMADQFGLSPTGDEFTASAAKESVEVAEFHGKAESRKWKSEISSGEGERCRWPGARGQREAAGTA